MSSMSLFSSKTAITQTASSRPSPSPVPSSSSASSTSDEYHDEPLPQSDHHPLEQEQNGIIISNNGNTASPTTTASTIRNKSSPSSSSSFYQEHCFYLIPMSGWFAFSAALSSYNKVVFGEDGRIHFPCPLLMTSIHFLAQWGFSETVCRLWPQYFGTDRVRRDMEWREWLGISVPCGLVTSGDVGLSNLSMVSISLTFYTMIKASTPIFVLFWAYIFGIERITWSLLGVVVIIACGEYLTCLGEVEFKWHGFLLCLCASILSGARWTLVQLKLQSLEPPLKTTVVTMRLLAPSMFFSLLFISLAIEQPWIALGDEGMLQGIEVLALGLLGAFLAICMVLFEFYLIMHASAILLMIGGVLKELLTIVVGVVCFGDAVNGTNLTGCLVVFLGVVLYKISFHLEKAEKKKRLKHAQAQQQDQTDGLWHLERADSTNSTGNHSSSHRSSQPPASSSNGGGHMSNGGGHMPVPPRSPGAGHGLSLLRPRSPGAGVVGLSLRSSPKRERPFVMTADLRDAHNNNTNSERTGLMMMHSSKNSNLDLPSLPSFDHAYHDQQQQQQDSGIGIELRRTTSGDEHQSID